MADEIRQYPAVAPGDLPVTFKDMGDGTYALVVSATVATTAADPADTPNVTTVATSITSVTIVASSVTRKSLIIVNDSKKPLLLRFGSSAASAADYSLRLGSQGRYEMPRDWYVGEIRGIWEGADASGKARITEIT